MAKNIEEKLYIRVWNNKNKFVGVISVKTIDDIKRLANTYPRYEYLNL